MRSIETPEQTQSIPAASGQVSIVAEAALEVAGRRPELSTGGGTSDGRFFAAAGAEVVEFGLLNRSIHEVDECCAVEDIARLQRVFEGILSRLFAR